MFETSFFGTQAEIHEHSLRRNKIGTIWNMVFLFATAVAVLFLILLIFSVIDSAFGSVAIRYAVEPSELSTGAESVADIPRDERIDILKKHLSSGILRRVEYEQPLIERSDNQLQEMIEQYVLDATVLRTWGLWDSVFDATSINDYLATQERSHLIFKSWFNPRFIVKEQSANPLFGGIRTALLGSLWIIMITFLFAFPIGVGAAIYLEEYAAENRLNRLIQLNIFNLSAVPSIIYGLLGLAVFVRAMESVTSGAVFGMISGSVANGRTILSGGLTLALLVLPIIIINTQEALKAVPDSLRLSSYGIGATKWQTIYYQVLPSCIDRILTGTILALSRALGETAPLVVIGASTFISVDPTSIFSKFTTLPIQIYQWSARPQGAYRSIAGAAIIALLILLLFMNSAAIILRDKLSKKKRTES